MKLPSILKNTQIKIDRDSLLSFLLSLSLILLMAYPYFYPGKTDATTTTAFIRFDRQSATAALSGVVCEKSSVTSGSVTKVILAFPSTFSIAGAASTWSIDTTAANLPNTSTGDAFTATAWPSIGGPTVVDTSTKAAIFTSADLTNSSNTYCFHFTAGGGSTVGTTGNDLTGSFVTQTVSGTPVETVSYASSITSGTNSEQISITASVSATFSFALSGGATGQALPLGVLSTSTPVTSPYTVTSTISTNAHNGFLAWVKGSSNGLYSNTTASAISSPGTCDGTTYDLSPGGNNGYGLVAATGTNSPTIASEYSANSTSVGHVDGTSFCALASKSGIQSGTTFTMQARAKPASTQAAANDYTDTLTVVAAGSF